MRPPGTLFPKLFVGEISFLILETWNLECLDTIFLRLLINFSFFLGPGEGKEALNTLQSPPRD